MDLFFFFFVHIKVECGDPGGIHDGFKGESHWPYSVNSTITYNCHPCYTGGGTITCQPNGKWTKKPECKGKSNLFIYYQDVSILVCKTKPYLH